MKIENILIEHFSRLRCANFALLFNKTLTDASSVRVFLRPTEIYVSVDDVRCTTIELSSLSVQIQINSLSLLLAKNNLISFRINIASNFQEEFLQVDGANGNNHFKPINLNIRPEETFSVICDNCHGPLTDALSFRRILELPSENMDSNEWFCHKHSHADNHDDSHTNDTPNRYNSSKFLPNDDDLFYGNFFAVANRKHFKNVQISTTHFMIHCRRCLSHIGELLDGTDKAVKVWNENVKISELSKDLLTETSSPQRIFADANSMLSNFIQIVNRISRDFETLGHQSQKMLFEARNRCGTTIYLFIQTMSRSLELYQASNSSQISMTADDEQPQSVISMERVNGIKCFFHCEENTDQALVQFWMNDINVIGAQISIEMLECAVESLQRLSKFVPEQFRMNNDFCLSYLGHEIN